MADRPADRARADGKHQNEFIKTDCCCGRSPRLPWQLYAPSRTQCFRGLHRLDVGPAQDSWVAAPLQGKQRASLSLRRTVPNRDLGLAFAAGLLALLHNIMVVACQRLYALEKSRLWQSRHAV